MSEKDEKIINAMFSYDFARVGTGARVDAAYKLEKVSAGISERDFIRIVEEYVKRLKERMAA